MKLKGILKKKKLEEVKPEETKTEELEETNSEEKSRLKRCRKRPSWLKDYVVLVRKKKSYPNVK